MLSKIKKCSKSIIKIAVKKKTNIIVRAKKAVAAYLKKRGDFGEALFVGYSKAKKTKDLSRLTPRSVERLVKSYATKAGITRKVTPHVIRNNLSHSPAQNLLNFL
jgi:site-specific recombinase XerD